MGFQVLSRVSNSIGIRRLATVADVPGETYIQKLHNLKKSAIDQGKPHFRVGENRIYFPSARVVLLRPNAKHSPYQAKFLVPKSFNKLDLRDYLYHIYGLRALSVTTQLMYGKYIRSLPLPFSPRHRMPQVKKMTIRMLEPFIWPRDELSENFLEEQKYLNEQNSQYHQDQSSNGSDTLKTSSLFGGIIDPHPTPTNFIAKKIGRKMKNTKIRDLSKLKRNEDSKIIRKFLL